MVFGQCGIAESSPELYWTEDWVWSLVPVANDCHLACPGGSSCIGRLERESVGRETEMTRAKNMSHQTEQVDAMAC